MDQFYSRTIQNAILSCDATGRALEDARRAAQQLEASEDPETASAFAAATVRAAIAAQDRAHLLAVALDDVVSGLLALVLDSEESS